MNECVLCVFPGEHSVHRHEEDGHHQEESEKAGRPARLRVQKVRNETGFWAILHIVGPGTQKQSLPLCIWLSPLRFTRLWRDVTLNLKLKDIDSATEAKHRLEEKQRAEARERKENEQQWETRVRQPAFVLHLPERTRTLCDNRLHAHKMRLTCIFFKLAVYTQSLLSFTFIITGKGKKLPHLPTPISLVD